MTKEELAAIMNAEGIVARSNMVVIRLVLKQSLNGRLYAPQNSEEGVFYVAVSIGSKVENLRIGDKVRCFGRKDIEWAVVPNTNGKLISVPEHLIPLTEGNLVFEETGAYTWPLLEGTEAETKADEVAV